jgi:hypothetical protein
MANMKTEKIEIFIQQTLNNTVKRVIAGITHDGILLTSKKDNSMFYKKLQGWGVSKQMVNLPIIHTIQLNINNTKYRIPKEDFIKLSSEVAHDEPQYIFPDKQLSNYKYENTPVQ